MTRRIRLGLSGLAVAVALCLVWARGSRSIDSTNRDSAVTKPARPAAEVDARGAPTESSTRGAVMPLTVSADYRVRGIVVGPNEAPVAGSSARFTIRHDTGREETRDVRCGASGEFETELSGSDLRVFSVCGIAPGFGATKGVQASVVMQRTDVGILTLRPVASISGLVEDEAGQPIAGAFVYARSRVGSLEKVELAGAPHAATTGADGRFRLDDVNPDGERVGFAAAGFAQLVRDLEPSDAAGEVRARLPRAEPLRLRVVDVKGTPVAGARVSYQRVSDFWTPDAMTDVDGTVRLPATAEGEPAFAVVVKNGFHVKHGSFDGVFQDGVCTLTPSPSARVHAVDAAGAPVPVTAVHVLRGAGAGNYVCSLTEGDRTAVATTDGAVHVNLDTLLGWNGVTYHYAENGPKWIHRIVAESADGRMGTGPEFRVNPDDTAPLEFKITLLEAAPVRGRVVLPNGDPLPDVRVQILTQLPGGPPGAPAAPRRRTALTDSSGAFTVPAVPAGRAEARAASANWTLVPVVLEIPEPASREELRLTVVKPGLVHGRATVGGAAPSSGLYIGVYSKLSAGGRGGGWTWVASVPVSRQGTYESPQLAPGTYGFALQAELESVAQLQRLRGPDPWPWTLDVEAGETRQLDIDAGDPRPSRIVARVSWNGSPVDSDARVVKGPAPLEYGISVKSNGVFVVDLRSSGPVSVEVLVDGNTLEREVSVKPGNDSIVDFAFAGGSVSGRILRADGRPASATVRLVRAAPEILDLDAADPRLLAATTDASGAFRAEHVAAGLYRAVAFDVDGSTCPTGSAPFTVAPGERIELPTLTLLRRVVATIVVSSGSAEASRGKIRVEPGSASAFGPYEAFEADVETKEPYVLWLPEDSHLVARITDLAGRPIAEKPFRTPRTGEGTTCSVALQIP